MKKKPKKNFVWVVEYFDSVEWRPMLRVFCFKKSAEICVLICVAINQGR